MEESERWTRSNDLVPHIYTHGCGRLGYTLLALATVLEGLVCCLQKQLTHCSLVRFLVCLIGQNHPLPDLSGFYNCTACGSLCSAEIALSKASSGESHSVICLRITATGTKHYQQNVPKYEILLHVLKKERRKFLCVS